MKPPELTLVAGRTFLTSEHAGPMCLQTVEQLCILPNWMRAPLNRMALLTIPLALLFSCSDGDGDATEFNETAARAAAIEWNPRNPESVDELVDNARAFCTDDQRISNWIEESQSFVSSEGRDVYLAACPATITDIAQRLALPIPA